jgi:hypothetical protein
MYRKTVKQHEGESQTLSPWYCPGSFLTRVRLTTVPGLILHKIGLGDSARPSIFAACF